VPEPTPSVNALVGPAPSSNDVEEEACRNRRRVTGKKQPLAIVPYVETALVATRSNPGRCPADEAGEGGSAGHYGVLGVGRGASAAEVRAAYRRRALESHPDKGGDPRCFHRVAAAFEVLTDQALRLAYDRDLELRESSDGLDGLGATRTPASFRGVSSAVSGPSASGGQAAARVAYSELLTCGDKAWAVRLENLQGFVLQSLLDLMKDPVMRLPVLSDLDSDIAEVSWASSGVKCIHHNQRGYFVAMKWAAFTVCTGYTQSLAQAIEWHIALARARCVALGRMRARVDRTASDPFTEDERLIVLEMEPSVCLLFRHVLKCQGEMHYTPCTHDLRRAREFRSRLLNAWSRSGRRTAVHEEKRRLVLDARKHEQEHRVRECQLEDAVVREISARSAASLGRDPTRKSGPSAVVVPVGMRWPVLAKPVRRLLGKRPLAITCESSLEGDSVLVQAQSSGMRTSSDEIRAGASAAGPPRLHGPSDCRVQSARQVHSVAQKLRKGAHRFESYGAAGGA